MLCVVSRNIKASRIIKIIWWWIERTTIYLLTKFSFNCNVELVVWVEPFFFLQHLIWYYEFLMWQDLCRTYICNAKLQWTSSDFKPQILSTALRMWCEPAVAQQEVSSWFFDNAWFFEPAWYILYVEYTYLYNKYAFNYSVMQLWLNYLSTQ